MARAIWQKTVTDNTGAPSNGAQVTVNIQDGGPATIFSLQEGGTSIANPFVTGIDGIARFYAERGYYTVTVFKDNSSVSFPWNNLGDKNLFDDLANTAFVESTDYAQALLADEDATEALTTLGISDYAQTLLADEDATEARSTLGLGTAALLSPTAYAQSLLDDANATEARATLELGTAAVVNASTYGASLIDDADASAARTTLGLGTAAVKNVNDMGDIVSSGIFLGGTSSENKLNDYEEGTWTPTIAFGGNSVGVVYTTSGVTGTRGRYTKIGNVVNVIGQVNISTKGSSTGLAQIQGLPFAQADIYSAVSLHSSGVSFTGYLSAFTQPNQSVIQLAETPESGEGDLITNVDINSGTVFIIFTLTYTV